MARAGVKRTIGLALVFGLYAPWAIGCGLARALWGADMSFEWLKRHLLCPIGEVMFERDGSKKIHAKRTSSVYGHSERTPDDFCFGVLGSLMCSTWVLGCVFSPFG